MSLDGRSVEEIIALLDLTPHPEGGFYRRTFRDARNREGRSHSTSIYYLLGATDRSAWHRIDAAEVWHHYAGAALEMRQSEDGRSTRTVRLGPDFTAGERFQIIVPRDCWQTAISLGEWTLCGCTVAPGFETSGFEMAPNDFDPAGAD